jgi:hypothetical protein
MMGIRNLMDQNKDTTVWSGVSLLLALADSSEIIRQAVVVILFPAIGWLLLYYVKKLVSYIENLGEETEEGEDNNQ